MMINKKKIALVTGSSKGIGNYIADYLLENDYIVYINGRNLNKISSSKKYKDKNIKFIEADLCKEGNVKKCLNKIKKNEGCIDLIVSNIGDGKFPVGYNFDINMFKIIFDINFYSSVLISRYAIEYMKKTGGQIIFIASIAGCESLPAPIAYSSAKAALICYAKNLSKDVAKYNIRVNSISPGNVMFKGSTWDKKLKNNPTEVKKYIKNNVPLNCFVEPLDIAKSVLFLENNSKITGSNIVIDAGQINKII